MVKLDWKGWYWKRCDGEKIVRRKELDEDRDGSSGKRSNNRRDWRWCWRI